MSRSLLVFALLVTPALAVDDEAAFVEALRERGEHELALEYLEGAEDRLLTTDGFRARLPYELAVTRLDSTRTIKDAARRSAMLSAAAEDVRRFTQASGDKRLAAEAETQLGGAYLSAAQIELARAEPLRGGDGAEPMLRAAREAFDKARARYTEAENLYKTELEKYRGVEADSPEGKLRLELRGLLSQVRLINKRALHQKAMAYPPGSEQFKSLNTQAASELSAFYEKYSRWLVGLYAHLYEGQCYLALKEYKLASGCFEDLVVQPDDEAAFRRLITLANAYLAETRIAEGDLEAALRDGVRQFESLRNGEDEGPDALALAYQLGRASMMQGEAAEGAERRRLLSDARGWLRSATRSANEYQADARVALNQLNDLLGASEAPLNNFKDAYQAARDAIASLSASRQAVKIAERNNPAVVEELVAESEDSRRRALAAIQSAITLTDESTPLTQLNEVRSQLAFLSWENEDYLQAAAVGEFLATRYPDDASAEQAANLALASLQRMYTEDREAGGDGSFASGRLGALTEAVLKTWPGTKTASGASSMLVSLALRDNRIDDARRVIESVDPRSRPGLELQLASAVWEQANRELVAAAGDDEAKRAAERKKREAGEMLVSAVEGGRSLGKSSVQLATAALYLSQSWIETGKPGDAVALLEDQEIGPITLLSEAAAATSRPGYAAEAYKLALRAYVSLDPPRTGDALSTMKRLEMAVRSDGGSKAEQRAKLTRVYFGLGVQLQRQIASLNERNKSKQANQLGAAFAAFLAKLSEQSVDADWTTRQWIGQTYLQLADGLTGEQAADYQGQARDVFRSMLDRAKEDPAYAPKKNSVLALRLQLGRAYRELGEYQQAFDLFSSILASRQALLEVQKEAAYTLQGWGGEDVNKLDDAVRGARLDAKTRKNLIWGWSKLSKVAANAARKRPEYKDLFFESWLNIATCRYLAAEQLGAGASRDKKLASARRTIGSMVRQYPELGGPEREKQFDRLAKRIQKLEGAEATGLDEFRNK